jgi:hypothetical protein
LRKIEANKELKKYKKQKAKDKMWEEFKGVI